MVNLLPVLIELPSLVVEAISLCESTITLAKGEKLVLVEVLYLSLRRFV